MKNYEARIDALQKQVEEQSMTMSMYSSYTPEDFNNEDDIFGKLSFVLGKVFTAIPTWSSIKFVLYNFETAMK